MPLEQSRTRAEESEDADLQLLASSRLAPFKTEDNGDPKGQSGGFQLIQSPSIRISEPSQNGRYTSDGQGSPSDLVFPGVGLMIIESRNLSPLPPPPMSVIPGWLEKAAAGEGTAGLSLL